MDALARIETHPESVFALRVPDAAFASHRRRSMRPVRKSSHNFLSVYYSGVESYCGTVECIACKSRVFANVASRSH
ncbi:hypothetical protein CUJ87_19095 [Paraburkholderia caledonica]|nr:hypothetical protein CUJ87_19095 [Paraburkholderia caledonica]